MKSLIHKHDRSLNQKDAVMILTNKLNKLFRKHFYALKMFAYGDGGYSKKPKHHSVSTTALLP